LKPNLQAKQNHQMLREYILIFVSFFPFFSCI
jgi:hypothetical protein